MDLLIAFLLLLAGVLSIAGLKYVSEKIFSKNKSSCCK